MILVAGATGTLGGRVVRRLLAEGHHVRILVRDPSPAVEMSKMGLATAPTALVAAGAEAVTGDLTDRASLDAACAGVETVITTATATKRDGQLEAVDLRGTLNLIAAAADAGVNHFIYTSAYGSAIGHPNPLYHIKGTCEQALEESGMTWTALQPGIFPEVWVGMVVGLPLQAGKPVTLVGQGDHKHAFISEADVAAFIVAAVDQPRVHNARLPLGGPSYSWNEVVATAAEVLGRPLPVRYVPPGTEVPLLDPMVGGLLAAQETYEDVIDMGDLPAQLGVRLTPLPEVLQQLFGARAPTA